MPLVRKGDEGVVDLVQRETAFPWVVGGLKICNRVDVEMQHELVRAGMNAVDRGLCSGTGAHALDIRRQITPQRRAPQRFLFSGIEPSSAEKGQVWVADERRLTPEPHEFRRASAGHVGDDHCIDRAGWRGRRGIEVRVAVHVNQANITKIAAHAGDRRQYDRTVAARINGRAPDLTACSTRGFSASSAWITLGMLR